MRILPSESEDVHEFPSARVDAQISDRALLVTRAQPVDFGIVISPQVHGNDRTIFVLVDEAKHILQRQDASLLHAVAGPLLIAAAAAAGVAVIIATAGAAIVVAVIIVPAATAVVVVTGIAAAMATRPAATATAAAAAAAAAVVVAVLGKGGKAAHLRRKRKQHRTAKQCEQISSCHRHGFVQFHIFKPCEGAASFPTLSGAMLPQGAYPTCACKFLSPASQQIDPPRCQAQEVARAGPDMEKHMTPCVGSGAGGHAFLGPIRWAGVKRNEPIIPVHYGGGCTGHQFGSKRRCGPDRNAGNWTRIAAGIATTRLHGHDANPILDFDLDLQNPAKIVNGDQRSVEQTPQALLRNTQRNLRPVNVVPVAWTAVVNAIIIVIVIVIVVSVAGTAVVIIIVVVIVIVAGAAVIAAIVIIIPVVVVAVVMAAIIAAAVTAAVAIVGKRGGGERMRRTGRDQREPNGCGHEPTNTHGGNKQSFSKRDVHDFRPSPDFDHGRMTCRH
ncbi:hypothetical protein [Ensifer sp. LC163]|uniref:hypothetical protein n=1 Tax=Ensifer sp. LC163 TaxID=1120652 RepID=UPI001374808D|nr:hypothetical protein [Ensifer sp. LC163]